MMVINIIFRKVKRERKLEKSIFIIEDRSTMKNLLFLIVGVAWSFLFKANAVFAENDSFDCYDNEDYRYDGDNLKVRMKTAFVAI